MNTKTLLISVFLISYIVCFGQKNQKKQEVDFVNSYIGTSGVGHGESEAGGLIPTVGPPFAMTSFSAQTCENMIKQMPYLYEDSTILGFIATHQPAVWMGDYGYVSIMPQIGKLKVLPQQRKLAFSHIDEFVSPYSYAVKMKADQTKSIKAEMTATERCGILKFTFPESDSAQFIIQALNIDGSGIPDWLNKVNSIENRLKNITAYISINKEKNEITGYNPDRQCLNLGPKLNNFKGYFIIQFDKPFTSFGTWNNDSIMPMVHELYGKKRLGAYISFSTRNKEILKVKIATSFISLDQARDNMNREIPDWDFDKVALKTRNNWQKNLEQIKIEGATDEQKAIFYSSFYHCLLYPRLFSEYGRYYSAYDDKVHDGVSYTDYSLWDTFRALHPFLIFTQPKRVSDMITSLLQMYKEGGRLPLWPNPAETNIMIGTHADAVIADAYIKGVRNFDVPLAYEAMRKDAMMPADCDVPSNKMFDRQAWASAEGQAGLSFFHSLGYVPSDCKSESVSRTIEYGIDDYCIAQVAKNLGKNDDFKKLIQWSTNYKNLYNNETGFFAPRLWNGNWSGDPNEGFTEGTPWTYLFGAMHDIPGTIDLMGGNETFAAKLDQNFSDGHYRHDNEPGHHYIYLYNYCGRPWKTQELIRKHTTVNYKNKPDGINGNDDCGQMSAWYIFSVMGFYPVTPASGIYSIGAPQYPKIIMNYSVDGKPHTFEILANSISEKNKYIQKLTLDGKTIDKPFISHEDIIKGHKLIFEMGPEPNFNWK